MQVPMKKNALIRALVLYSAEENILHYSNWWKHIDLVSKSVALLADYKDINLDEFSELETLIYEVLPLIKEQGTLDYNDVYSYAEEPIGLEIYKALSSTRVRTVIAWQLQN